MAQGVPDHAFFAGRYDSRAFAEAAFSKHGQARRTLQAPGLTCDEGASGHAAVDHLRDLRHNRHHTRYKPPMTTTVVWGV